MRPSWASTPGQLTLRPLRGPFSLGFPRDRVSGLSLRMSRQVISFRGQRLKRRLVAQFLISRSVHRSGADAIIDLNQAIDSSVDASCHARKIRRELSISNDRDSPVSIHLGTVDQSALCQNGSPAIKVARRRLLAAAHPSSAPSPRPGPHRGGE